MRENFEENADIRPMVDYYILSRNFFSFNNNGKQNSTRFNLIKLKRTYLNYILIKKKFFFKQKNIYIRNK